MDAAIFGLIVADLIASPMDLRTPPPPGWLAQLDKLELTTGGNVCNVGIAMARLGMRVAGAGLVGEDVIGTAMLDRLKGEGVETSHVFRTTGAQTSASIVAVEPGGQRYFFHTSGATKLLDADAFRRCFPLFAKSDVVQVGYFGLLPSLKDDFARVFEELRKAVPGARIALDTVYPPEDMKRLEPALPHVSIFAPSRTEATALVGETEPTKMVAAFRRFMPEGLIGIKLDDEGCFLDDGRREVFAPAYKIDVVDTTGAGDTWFAGLLTALHHDMPLEQAGRFANRAAADCCTAFGASAGVRSFGETLAAM